MDLQTPKLELVKLIVNSENQKIIEQFIKILKAGEEDFWTKLSKEEKEEIELGIQQLDFGKKNLF